MWFYLKFLFKKIQIEKYTKEILFSLYRDYNVIFINYYNIIIIINNYYISY